MQYAYRLATFFFLALLLSGCATALGPRTIVFSQDELQQKLGKSFPLVREHDGFTMTLDTPALTLLPQENRLALGVNAVLRSDIFDRSYRGTFAASFSLRFDATDLSLKATDVKIEKIAIDGLPGKLQQLVDKLDGLIVERQIDVLVLHHFKPEDFGTPGRLGYTVGRIDVTPDGLAVQLVPKN